MNSGGFCMKEIDSVPTAILDCNNSGRFILKSDIVNFLEFNGARAFCINGYVGKDNMYTISSVLKTVKKCNSNIITEMELSPEVSLEEFCKRYGMSSVYGGATGRPLRNALENLDFFVFNGEKIPIEDIDELVS